MKTLYEIEIDVITDAGEVHPVPPDVAAYLAVHRVDRSNSFRFDNVRRLNEAELFLQDRGIKFQRFFRFAIDREEVAAHPAFYLGPEVFFDLVVDNRLEVKKLKGLDIALDYESERCVMTLRLQAALVPITSGLTWRTIAGSNGRSYAIVDDMAILPEPIVIPNAVEISEKEDPPGTYSVRNDGRSVLSDANREALSKLGIARAERVVLSGERSLTSPRRLVSGLGLDAMLRINPKGLQPLVPLLLPNHPALSM
jgi:hypothetical protein